MTEQKSAIEKIRLSGAAADSNSSLDFEVSKLDRILDPWSDWFSSILIKEARQAVKSKQFVWTYVLQLVLVAAWTAMGFASLENDLGFGLLVGYLIILGFPLAVIIPFSGYRSLAREFDDGTIRLISITTMKPRQIILGKLGSALIQLVMYLAVLAPCICFTYLLQGVSIGTITIGLSVSVGGSIFLTIFGLFLAGSFRSRALGVGVSVVFSIALGFAYFLWILFCVEISNSNVGGFGSDEYVVVTGFIFSVGSTALLLLAAVVAQISFPSDNRSTWIRIMMLVQQTLFLAWICQLICLESIVSEMPKIILMVIGHYWLLMGFMMCGESSDLSRRVRRSLPKSLIGRLLISLFMPGSGRGFLFALANVWAVFLIVFFLMLFEDALFDWNAFIDQKRGRFRNNLFAWNNEVSGMFICTGFVTWYLSLVFMANRYLWNRIRRKIESGYGPAISLIFGVAIVSLITIMAFLNEEFFVANHFSSDLAMSFNWYSMTFHSVYQFPFVFFIVFVVQAVIVTVFAIFFASKDFLVVAVETPERVLIERRPGKKKSLPVGESIDEIFGVLPAKSPGGDDAN